MSTRKPVNPPDPVPGQEHAYCRAMLPLVSRTFAACIRLLPPQLEHAVLVAYLLCRIADTCEDTADLPLERKHALLARFRVCLDEDGPDAAPLRETFSALRAGGQARIADEHLTEHADTTLTEFRRLPAAARAAIRPWVQEMCDGMASFATMQEQCAPGRLIALEDEAALDRYCWYVAGTVGHLLTDLFAWHHPRMTQTNRRRLDTLATSFGLGLQLTNIIKDVADDRQRGWSFVPRQLCESAGIDPASLLDPARATAARTVMDALVAKTRSHLADALDYCCALPRPAYRIRLFCLAPLFFAVRTLAVAARDPRLLDPGHKVKISRGEVYRILCACHLVAPSNHLIRAYFRQLERKRARD